MRLEESRTSGEVTLKGEIELRNRLSSYRPYAKQAEFHALGARVRERLLMAANRFGKTECGAAEMAMHLTGRYPGWWQGKRFAHPVRAWAAGITHESTRDVVQAKLIGPPERSEAWGSGLIPPDALHETFLARHVRNVIDTVSIKHVSGGFSSLQFKSYEKGREKWQGTALEAVWFDEEPPLDIYLEGLTRTNETGGIVFVTFTPVLGHTDVVNRFLKGPHEDRAIAGATIFEAEHLSPDQRERIVASYPAHQRDARVKGLPVLGTGHVFPVSEETITCAPFAIPAYWPQINGLDFGWDHPFGAVNCAWDRDADLFYVCKEYREREATPLVHAAAVKPWGEWIPCAWPHDGLQHDKGSGEELARAYRLHGLAMLADRATFLDGTNGVEAGVLEMLERMLTGRFKVFSNCAAWLEEFRLYHREAGRIVKRNDDLISASRYAYMMRRFASVRPRRHHEPPPRGAYEWMK
jgi:phage terminase large subunit-like protein